MKSSTYFKHILPSFAVSLGLLLLPLAVTTYFVVTQYSDRLGVEYGIDYYAAQSSWLSPIVMNGSWIDGMNRFMDFAFWGMLALIVMVIGWTISSAKVAFKNHYAIEEFANFRESRVSWHSHFYVVLFLKIATGIIFLYAVIAVLARQAPQLSLSVANMLHEFNGLTLKDVLMAAAALYLYAFLAVTAAKTFLYLRAD